MKEQLSLKYACLDQFDKVIANCFDENTKKYLLELKNLIVYQMDIIKEQRMEIVAYKHNKAWKMYENI